MHLPTTLLLWISKWLDEPISQTHKVKMKHRSGEYFFSHSLGVAKIENSTMWVPVWLSRLSWQVWNPIPVAHVPSCPGPVPFLFFTLLPLCSSMSKINAQCSKKKDIWQTLHHVAPIARLFEQAVMIPWVVDPEFWVWGIFRGFVYCHIIVLYIVLL